MKKFILTLLAIAFITIGYAQSPESFTYQAVVRDGSGNVLANQSVGIQIRILETSASGTAVYTETFTENTNDFGLVNLAIGTGTSSDDFSTINWAGDAHFIEVGIDPAGGTSYAITGTSQLLSVPYALNAKSAQNVKWTDFATGPGIHYFPVDFSNVAINDNPSAFSKLLVSVNEPSTSSLSNFRAFNYNSDGFSQVMVSNNAASNFVLGVNGSASPFGASEAYLWYFADFDIKMATGSVERLRIKNTAGGGRVEIKTGDVYIENVGSGVIMKSPDGNCWRMTVDNAGNPVFTGIACP